MGIGIAVIVIAALVVAIWLVIEVKRLRHKVFAVFLIALILFTYLSFSITLKDKEIDYKSISGLGEATKLYFAWLGSMFGNMRSITTHAIKMDWKGNETG